MLADSTAGRLAATALAAGSRLRRKRVFHPDGVAFRAELTVRGGAGLGPRLLDEPAVVPCTTRLSRGVGLPDGWPDILGVAVRTGGDRSEQDLLFATVLGDGAGGRHVLAPSRGWGERPLSTILPYRVGGAGLVTLVLRPETAHEVLPRTLEEAATVFESGELTFALAAVRPSGTSVPVGRLTGGPRLSGSDAEALRYNPFNAAHDLQPAGAINALRRRSYAASQAARLHEGRAATV
jgi:hypothetical protein